MKTDYIKSIEARHPVLSVCSKDIGSAVDLMISSIKGNGTIFTCGNGGSSADSDHIVGELMKGFHLKRKLSDEVRKEFSDLFVDGGNIADNLQGAIRAISLCGNMALISAFANDVNADFIFAQQIYGLGNAGDILICLSTSGNSKNIIKAAMTAKFKKMIVVGFTGSGGGELKTICDITIKVPSTITPEIQEYHQIIYHAICAEIENRLFYI